MNTHSVTPRDAFWLCFIFFVLGAASTWDGEIAYAQECERAERFDRVGPVYVEYVEVAQ